MGALPTLSREPGQSHVAAALTSPGLREERSNLRALRANSG